MRNRNKEERTAKLNQSQRILGTGSAELQAGIIILATLRQTCLLVKLNNAFANLRKTTMELTLRLKTKRAASS